MEQLEDESTEDYLQKQIDQQIMEKYEIIGYFIELKKPENVLIRKKYIESTEQIRYVFNTFREVEFEMGDDYYLINKSIINITNDKERLIYMSGMSCFIKSELL